MSGGGWLSGRRGHPERQGCPDASGPRSPHRIQACPSTLARLTRRCPQQPGAQLGRRSTLCGWCLNKAERAPVRSLGLGSDPSWTCSLAIRKPHTSLYSLCLCEFLIYFAEKLPEAFLSPDNPVQSVTRTISEHAVRNTDSWASPRPTETDALGKMTKKLCTLTNSPVILKHPEERKSLTSRIRVQTPQCGSRACTTHLLSPIPSTPLL